MSDSGELTVRPATADDVNAVRDLVRAAYAHYIDRIGRAPAPMDTDYASEIAAGTVRVAIQNDRICGVLELHQWPDHVLIDNVAVDPRLQGAGIGSELLHVAERHARELGLTQTRLYTHVLMTENIAYYARRGYAETERKTEAGFARVYFTKAL